MDEASCQTDFDDALEVALLKQWQALSQRCDRCTQTIDPVTSLDVGALTTWHITAHRAEWDLSTQGPNRHHPNRSLQRHRPGHFVVSALQQEPDGGQLPLGPVSSLLSKPMPAAVERLPRIEDLYRVATHSHAAIANKPRHLAPCINHPQRMEDAESEGISWRPEVAPKEDHVHSLTGGRHAAAASTAAQAVDPELQKQKMIYFKPSTVGSMSLADVCSLERRLLRLQKLRGAK